MKLIVGYPNYQITKDGRIWIDKYEKFLRQYLTPDGYSFVHLWDREKSEYKNYFVHRLVLQTHFGPCPKGMECCHNDGIKTNNHLDNLRWDTHKNNVNESNIARGSRQGLAKLDESDARFVIYLSRTKLFTQKEIGRIFGITQAVVSKVINKRTWRHIWEGRL